MSRLSESMIRIWKNKGQILEGIKNSVFRQEHIEEIAIARLEICKTNRCGSYDTTGKGCAVPGTEPCCNMNNGGCGWQPAFRRPVNDQVVPEEFLAG